MRDQPSSCDGCALSGLSSGFMSPSLARDPYGVALVGEALGETEDQPFVGPAGHTLTRLVELAGLDRARFDIWNAVWCRPPDNLLENQPYEQAAISHCRSHHWHTLTNRVRVVVPMGNVAMAAFVGRKGVLKQRGYVSAGNGYHILPTVHPSFIRRGQAKYSRAFINDIQKAVMVAQHGMEFTPTHYVLDPLPGAAEMWARAYLAALRDDPTLKLAYDIETPGKDEDESESEDPTYHIWRIGFSYGAHTALSVPWEPPYFAAISLLLGSEGEKVVWNAGFDNPRIIAKGMKINGLIHDGMIAWHILHSDLPKGLGFVATFTCPYQPAWKHLSIQQPAFYNATDADVEWRSMMWIEAELKRTGLWKVYDRDVLQLDPILSHMSIMGMPVDHATRYDRACRLGTQQKDVARRIEALVPLEARRIAHVYKTTPKDITNLLARSAVRRLPVCDHCGDAEPTKPHFRTFKRPTAKKPQNPCAGAQKVEREIAVTEYYRLADFTPSRDQLIRYQQYLKRHVPTTWDKKTRSRKKTMDEKALKRLMGRYPDDPIYQLVLDYRELQKLAGTYIGYPEEE